MEKEKIYFIYMPSPTLGRSLIQGVGGLGFFGNIFGIYTEDKYVSVLESELERRKLNWTVQMDDTESDIEKIIKKKIKLLICAPGLKYQFYKGGFNKENIIYLNMMEYVYTETDQIIQKIRKLENENENENET